MSKNTTIMQNISENPLPWVVQTVTILLFIGNLYLASLLYPIARDIQDVTKQVRAIEVSLEDRPGLIQDFKVMEEQIKGLRETTVRIEKHLERIENKIDRL